MSDCTDKRISGRLLAYELGMLSDEERKTVELHVMECADCFEKLRQFALMSEMMRDDTEAREQIRVIAERDLSGAGKPVSPVRWWQWKRYGRFIAAAAVVALISILIPMQFEIRTGQDLQATPDKVLILNFDDRQTDNRLGEVVASLLITDLSESEFVRVVPRERVSDLRASFGDDLPQVDHQEYYSTMARSSGARWVLKGEVLRDRQSTIITSTLFSYPGGDVVASQRVTGLSDESIYTLVDRLTTRIKHDLSLPSAAFDEHDPRVADVTTHFPEAYLSYLEGVDYDHKLYNREAIAAYERCLEIDSTYAMAYYHLSRLTDRGIIQSAVDHIDRAGQREKYLIRSRAALYLHGGEGYEDILEELLARFPDERDALYDLGLRAFGVRDYHESIRRMRAVLETDSLFKPAYNQLAYAYDEIGDLDKAIETIEAYIRLAPNEANPYDTRGDIYARNGLIEEAISSYRAALEKKPDFRASAENLGHMYLFQGDYEEATQAYTSAMEFVDAQSRTLNRLNVAFVPLRQGKLQMALTAIDEAIKDLRVSAEESGVTPPNTPHYEKAMIYNEQGRYDLAVEEVRECIRLSDLADPNNELSYRWMLAYYSERLGEHDRADSVIASLREYYERNPGHRLLYYWAAGTVALERGDIGTAVSMFEQTIAGLTPATGFKGHYELGNAYLLGGRYDDAIRVLEEASSVYDPVRLHDGIRGVKVHYLLGRAYEEVGQYTEAAEQYTVFLEIWRNADSGLEEIEDARDRLTGLKNRS